MEFEILSLINEIEEQSYFSEMTVMDSMIALYTKEAQMLCYTSSDIVQECFYQEGVKWDKFKDDVNAGIKGKQGEGVLKKILLFIPRAIASLIKLIKNVFTKSVSDTITDTEQAVKTAESLNDQEAEVVELIAEVVDNNYNNVEKMDQIFREIGQRHSTANEYIKNHNDHTENNEKKLDNINKTFSKIDKDLADINERLDKIHADHNAVADAVRQTVQTKKSRKRYSLSWTPTISTISMSYNKTREQRQFLKNVAKALHGNEIRCGFNISMCLHVLDVYDQYIVKFSDAITYYESHKLEVFIKKLEDINDDFRKFKMHDVDLRYSIHRAGMTSIGDDEFGNFTVAQTSMGDKVSLSEFTHGMQRMLKLSASLSDKCDDIHKTLTEAFQQYNEKKNKLVDRRDDELQFLSRAFNDKKITSDEYDKRYTEINNRYGESENYKNYFSIRDSVMIFNSISANIEAFNIVIDHYHREVICYNKIAKAVKSKKAINMRKSNG